MAPQPDIQKWTITEPYLNLHCLLGEGPYYEKETRTLRFVDIRKRHLHVVSLTKGFGTITTIHVDEPISVTANIENRDPSEEILVALKSGIAILDRKSGGYKYITSFPPHNKERLRSNDGAVDPSGRLWLGTMTDFGMGSIEAEGSLYRIDGALSANPILSDLKIPNSVGWSPDGKTMYFTHTGARQVLAYEFSGSDGTISNQRVFYKHEGPGEPDGFRVDVEGNTWHAIYGEGRVLRINSEGKITGQIELPTRNVTCVEFVGTELFMTTAEDEGGDAQSKELAGALFRVDVGVQGLDHNVFKIKSQ